MTTQTTDGQATTRAARRASGGGGFGPGDRLPVPTRQRRPMLAILAVVLILGGAAIAASLVLTSGQKQEYLLLKNDVRVGQTLVADDFLAQPLAKTNSAVFAPVPVSDFKTRVSGQKARVALSRGTLLTEGTFGPAISPRKGLTDTSAAVPEGGYPVDLRPGDIVKVIYTPRSNATNNANAAGSAGNGATSTAAPKRLVPGMTLIGSAYVTSVVDNTTGEGGKVVGLEIRNEEFAESPLDGLPALAYTNAADALTIVRLDPTVTYDKGD
jgi:hypothetical protein